MYYYHIDTLQQDPINQHKKNQQVTIVMDKVFGHFEEDIFPEDCEFLQLGFSPSCVSIQERWRNNGLSADFVADYVSTFFPVSIDDPVSQNKQAEIKSSVSYIANELLENAMKFNYKTFDSPIKFGINLLKKEKVFIYLYASNRVNPEQLEDFEAFIEEFLSSDSQELYLKQVEKSMEDEQHQYSRLGLITMKNDYQAELGWKFSTTKEENEEVINVTTMITLKA